MSGHEIRQATPDDYGRVGEICLAAYSPSDLPIGHGYWDVLRDTAARVTDSEVWVAVDGGGEVVGTVTWCLPGSAHREVSRPGEAEFRLLAVDPDRQGEGIGAALVAAVLDRARADGCSAVVLSSAGWMQTAHRLYARCGFVRTPELDWVVTGVALSTYRLDLAER